MSVRRLLPAAAAVLAIGGCSILSEPPAEQLYRFGASPSPAAPESTPAAPALGLGMEQGAFPREADGVRILTTEGSQVAYLSGARWAAPADNLFETAVLRAVRDASPDIALFPRGAGGGADHLLRVDVTRFEADYVNGAGAPPTVRVRASASVFARVGHRLIAQREFAADQPAVDNRVSAVVGAYDAAVSDVTRQIGTWTVSTARQLPGEPAR